MSMTSLSKHEDQQMDHAAQEEKNSFNGASNASSARGTKVADNEDEVVTFRSWLYAALGCYLYFCISYSLAATSQWRTAQGAFVDPTKNSIWLINVISLFQACLGPLLMGYSDLFERRYLLIVVSGLAVVGSAISSRANSWNMALAGQCLTAIGTAVVGAAYAVPSEVMPRKWRGGVQCAVNLCASCGGTAGVLITGALLRSNPTEGWRPAGYIATGLWAAYFILTTTLYFPPPRHVLNDELTTSEKLRSVDWIGYFLLAAGLSLFLVGTTQGGSIGWKEAKTLGPLISGILVSFAFCLYEWKGTSTGLCHHALFQNRNFGLCLAAVAVEGAIMFCLLAFLGVAASALWTQDRFVAAAYTAPFYAVSIVIFPFLGWYTAHYKEFRVPLLAGYVLYLGAMIGFTQTTRNSGGAAWALVSLCGLGFSAPIALLVAVGQLATPGAYIGAASALLVSARAIGAAIAVAIYAAVLSSKLSHNIPEGIVAGAFKGGLQPQQVSTILPQLIPKIASQNGAVIQSAFAIPGVTPQIVIEAIHGMQDGFASGMKYVWICGTVFSAVGIISVVFLQSSRHEMTRVVDAPAQEKHEHAHGERV